MPSRSRLSIADIVDVDTLATAFWQAARRKRHREDVACFADNMGASLARLRSDILSGLAPRGRWTKFEVFDPKRRQILAPCFNDRVLHHALMLHMAPILDRALVDDSFACRIGKGTLAAAKRAQVHARRFAWHVKVDVRAYFASINHGILLDALRRRFKDRGVISLCSEILRRTPLGPDRGLPIGALTSQHFANTYLDAFDRFLLEKKRVRAMVRYMDDVVFWCDSRAEAKSVLMAAREFLSAERQLELKQNAHVGRSRDGVSFLGFRIMPGSMRLSLRRRRRYSAARRRWEIAHSSGVVASEELQSGYAAALGITAHADAVGWRRSELLRRPPLDA